MEVFHRFWLLVVDVWQHGLMGVNIGRMVTSLCIFVLFLFFRRLISRPILYWLKTITRKTRMRLDDEVVDSLDAPVRLIPVVLGLFLAAEHLQLTGTLAQLADRIVRSFIVFNLFWAFVRLTGPMSIVLKKLEKVFSAEMVEWLIKAFKAGLVFIGAATILEIWGIRVGPIIAGMGLLGVAVALGAQDLFKNLIAGILILAEKRFVRGDWIKVNGVVEGTVESIGFRSTRVRRFDKAPVYVPNAQLSDHAVVNFSAMSHRRIYWMIGLEYRTTLEQLREIRDKIEAYLLENDDFAKPPDVSLFVRVDRFSESSTDLMLYCFTLTTNWGQWLQIKEDLAFFIKKTVLDAGAGFAFPSRSIYMEPPPEGAPQEYTVPAETENPPS